MSNIAATGYSIAKAAKPISRVADLDKDLRLVLYSIWLSLAMAMFKEVFNDPSILFIGTYNLSVTDPIIVLQVWALSSLYSRRAIRNDLLTWLSFGMAALVLVGIVRGIDDGLFLALRSMRTQGAFAFFLLMVPVLPRNELLLSKIRDALIIYAFVTAVLVVLRFVLGTSLFMRAAYQTVLDINDGGRPITADGALVMGIGIAMFLSRWIERGFGRLSVFAAPAFATLCLTLLLTAQATAIFGSLVSIALVGALHPSLSRSSRVFLVTMSAFVSVLLVLYLSGYFGPVDLSFLPQYVQDNFKRRSGSAEFRQYIWTGLMVDYQRWDIMEQIFGMRSTDKPYIFMPYGGGMYWWSSVHSMYFGALVFMGALGISMYIAMMLSVISGGLRWVFAGRDTWPHFGGAIPLAIIAAIAVFGYSYEIRDEHAGLILFAVIASRPLQLPGSGMQRADRARRFAR